MSGLEDFTNGTVVVDGQAISLSSKQFPILVNEFHFDIPSVDLDFLENPFLRPDLGPMGFPPQIFRGQTAETYSPSASADSLSTSSMGMSPGAHSPSDDSEFSETVLRYMSQILMEEDIEDKPCMFYDPLGLQITEKSFYDALSQENPPPPPSQPPPCMYPNLDSPDDFVSGSSGDYATNSSSTTSTSTVPQGLCDLEGYKSSFSQATLPGDHVPQPNFLPNNGSQLQTNPLNVVTSVGDGLELLARNIFSDSESVLQFRRGLEEASKFLPSCNQLLIDPESSTGSTELNGENPKGHGEKVNSSDGSRGRKNHEREDIDLEEVRSNKQSAVQVENNELPEMFDKVLLCTDSPSVLSGSNEPLQNETSKASPPTGQTRGANVGRSRAKKQGKKKETIDLSTLLIKCAQAVSAGDCRNADDLLKQIRQHSSPFGDGSERVAHFFANGLEARLAGTGIGAQIFYASLASKRISTSDMLKAYKVHLSACPFRRTSLFFANRMIYNVAEKAKRLHIIDFGIQYGFHWPLMIQKLSKRPGGPPNLRITGIELPQPGFRPTELIEETGRRLTNYCERFNVPFEYQAIASNNWETIEIERLTIDRSEVLAVHCLFRSKNILDETVKETSPRDAFLNLLRRMNPDIFVHSIVNGTYNAPFFVTRFREALFHFSTLYDIFDVTLPRDNQEKLMFEREFIGREAMNVIACEGLERVERPETYKQWQARTLRAGFRQLPLDQELVNIFKAKMKEWYHKDFILEEDNHWLLQGWKGRIVYASTCWAPASKSCTQDICKNS